jgi:hypothetical protein
MAIICRSARCLKRLIWAIWAIGLFFVGYSGSQDAPYVTWFAPVWLFLPFVFINTAELISCFRSADGEIVPKTFECYNEVIVTSDFPESDYLSDTVTCVICLSDVGSGDNISRLPCGHEYHASCVGEYIQRQLDVCSSTGRSRICCAVCRRPILPNEGCSAV